MGLHLKVIERSTKLSRQAKSKKPILMTWNGPSLESYRAFNKTKPPGKKQKTHPNDLEWAFT
jgi:hypothetical protein